MSPTFAKCTYFPSCFDKMFNFSPDLQKIPESPMLKKYVFYIVIVPYFDHNAFMHHTTHVLEVAAPVSLILMMTALIMMMMMMNI